MEPRNRNPQIRLPIVRVAGHSGREADDVLAVEEPLEIRLRFWKPEGLAEQNIAVTMRTPGADFELATGFLFAEGILRSKDDYFEVGYCLDVSEEQAFNVVSVTLMPNVPFDPSRLERHFYTTSSCGVCGKATLEALEVQGCEFLEPQFTVESGLIQQLPARLRASQDVFEQTGGLHAAGLFELDGTLRTLREDVGRHNALDKVIGAEVMAGRSRLDETILVLSGRASFELLQKALVARIPVVVAVGAPSSLAVDLARDFGITLIGFARETGFNIYTHPERIATPVNGEIAAGVSEGDAASPG